MFLMFGKFLNYQKYFKFYVILFGLVIKYIDTFFVINITTIYSQFK